MSILQQSVIEIHQNVLENEHVNVIVIPSGQMSEMQYKFWRILRLVMNFHIQFHPLLVCASRYDLLHNIMYNDERALLDGIKA